MDNDKNKLGDDLCDNKAVQTGAAALMAAGATKIGIATGSLTAISTGKAGVIIASLGPAGLVIGGALLVGGITAVIIKRYKKRHQ